MKTHPPTHPIQNSTVVPAATSTCIIALGGLPGRVQRRCAAIRAADGRGPIAMVHLDVDSQADTDDPHLPTLASYGGSVLRLNGAATRNLLIDARQEAVDPLSATIAEDARAIGAARFVQISESLNNGRGAGQRPVVGAAAIIANRYAILETLNAPLATMSRSAGERGRIVVVASGAGAMGCGGLRPLVEMLHDRYGGSADIETISMLPATILGAAMKPAAYEKQRGPMAHNSAAHLKDLQALAGGGDDPRPARLKRAMLIGDTDDSGQRVTHLEEMLELTAHFLTAYVDGGLADLLSRTSMTNQDNDAPGTFTAVGVSTLTTSGAVRIPLWSALAQARFWTQFADGQTTNRPAITLPAVPELAVRLNLPGDANALLRTPLPTLRQKLGAQRIAWREQVQDLRDSIPDRAKEHGQRVAEYMESALAQRVGAGADALAGVLTAEISRLASSASQARAQLTSLTAGADRLEPSRGSNLFEGWFGSAAKRELESAEMESRVLQQRMAMEWMVHHLEAGRDALATILPLVEQLKLDAQSHAVQLRGEATRLQAALITTDRIFDVGDSTDSAFEFTPEFSAITTLAFPALDVAVRGEATRVATQAAGRETVKKRTQAMPGAELRRLAERVSRGAVARITRLGGSQASLMPSRYTVSPSGPLVGEFASLAGQQNAGWIATIELMPGLECDSIAIPQVNDGSKEFAGAPEMQGLSRMGARGGFPNGVG